MKNLQLLIIPLLVFISCEEKEESDLDLGDYHLFTATFEEGAVSYTHLTLPTNREV